ncbi:MAG: hypothetical protein ABI840_06915 [bacterium]
MQSMQSSTCKSNDVNKKIIYLFISVMVSTLMFTSDLFAQDSKKKISFKNQNKLSNYISISGGMGITYSNNPSLTNYIELDVPNYTFIPNEQKVSPFTTGIEFFVGVEPQLAKKFSVKAEYTYRIKSLEIPTNLNYQYSYFSHNPMILFNYIFLQEYSYIKFGIGGGYLMTKFIRKERNLETEYNSTGADVKLEGIFNAQLGKSAAVYLSGFLINSFMSNLKNDQDIYLVNLNNEKVNLSSFGAGVRLGLEVFIF